MAEGEKRARPPETTHDLVAYEKDAVLVAKRAHPLHVAHGLHQHSVCADDGLEDHCRDRSWASFSICSSSICNINLVVSSSVWPVDQRCGCGLNILTTFWLSTKRVRKSPVAASV